MDIKEFILGYKKAIEYCNVSTKNGMEIRAENKPAGYAFAAQNLGKINFAFEDIDDIVALAALTAACNDADTFTMLLSLGYKINALNSHLETFFNKGHSKPRDREFYKNPLCEKLDFVQFAYERGADFSKKNKHNGNLFSITLENTKWPRNENPEFLMPTESSEKVFEYLMGLPYAKAQLNETFGEENRTLFHLAVANNRYASANLLLNMGVDINAVYTYFDDSAKYSEGDILSPDKGAGFSKPKHITQNALHMICKTGAPFMLEFLIKRGINLAAVNSEGLSCIHLLVRGGSRLDNRLAMLEILKANGADLDAKCDGITPLYLALSDRIRARDSIGYKYFDGLIHKLIDLGADVSAASNDGTAVVHLVSALGNFELLKKCALKGVNINQKNNAGETPLLRACLSDTRGKATDENRNINKVIMALVHMGADIKAANHAGDTPVDILSKSGNSAMVEFLLSSLN